MEELRSTEILDKEIQEDARKKADKIVKNSQIEAQNILDSVDGRIEGARQEKEKFYAQKLTRFEKDTNASLPLEKQRFLVSFEDEEVTKAIKNYLENLSLEKKSELLKELLNKYKNILENRKVNIFAVDFDKTLAEKIAVDVLGKKSIVSCQDISDFKKQILTEENPNFVQGFVLKSDDKAITCRVLLSEIINNIRDKNSFELAQTLFCGRLPQ
jgi:V/A-type H+-transporting ATPase subunit E